MSKWKWATHKYAAKKFASGRFAGLGVDVSVVPAKGLDYSITDNRPHYHITDSRPHYKIDDNRLFVKAAKHAN